MYNYITIDGGTTNTRISIVSDGKIIDTLKIKSDSNTEKYKIVIKDNINELLKKNGFEEKDIIRILISGTMATAEFGICPLDYVVTPVNIKMLKKESCEVVIPEISDIPFVVIRGVKTKGDSLDKVDTMRGEESELAGIMSANDKSCVYMLMGSHSKIITTDDNGNIVDICTMLSGELIEAVSKLTILKNSLVFEGSTLDSEYIKKGYNYCSKKGINEALFKVRVLKNIFQETNSRIYSFFLGAILHGEVQYILNSDAKKIVVGGNKFLKDAAFMLLKEYVQCDVMSLSDEVVENAVPLGLVKIFEHED
ncbi:MAG: 2-dehydro-3-deoxygalactonokinase [Clostridia bacterium]|nr:2-dehydro-3-deoxygalactonokinase [Clostridia bacterium]